jgi:hypothetical protein
MSTPTGKLAYGQAGVYDAIDDRSVIAAVTGYRTGLTTPLTITPGSGLNMTVAGGWLGIADCGDLTSAVVGSRTDQSVAGLPGPATGSRTDLLWCDVDPDNGAWTLAVILAADATGRPGLSLASIIVPANATLASQMTITPNNPELERRLMAIQLRNDNRTSTGQTWGAAETIAWTPNIWHDSGHWYRIKFDLNSPCYVTGSDNGRLGVGWAPPNGSEAATALGRAVALVYPRANVALHASVEWIYQWAPSAPPAYRLYRGRLWSAGAGTYKPQAVTGQGDGIKLTVEDLGT